MHLKYLVQGSLGNKVFGGLHEVFFDAGIALCRELLWLATVDGIIVPTQDQCMKYTNWLHIYAKDTAHITPHVMAFSSLHSCWVLSDETHKHKLLLARGYYVKVRSNWGTISQRVSLIYLSLVLIITTSHESIGVSVSHMSHELKKEKNSPSRRSQKNRMRPLLGWVLSYI